MTEPCQQINRLETVDDKLDKLAEVLTTVAVQKSEIAHLVTIIGDMKTLLYDIEKRTQILERNPGQGAMRFIWILVTVLTTAVMSSIVTIVLSTAK